MTDTSEYLAFLLRGYFSTSETSDKISKTKQWLIKQRLMLALQEESNQPSGK